MALGYGRVVSNNFGTAKYIVDTNGISTGATHNTIAAALTSASSGETIFIRPGTYTENLTLKAGVNLAAYDADAYTPNVTIVGKCTFTGAGSVSISGIRLQTNSDNFLAVTGSSASVVNITECYLNCSNATGITFSSSSSSSAISIRNCKGDVGTTAIKIFDMSAAGRMTFEYCAFTNTGSNVTASTASAGNLNLKYCSFTTAITTSSTNAFGCEWCGFEMSSLNTTCLTLGGSGTSSVRYSVAASGTASAISCGSTVGMFNTNALSTNTNAITGAGTITANTIGFLSTGSSVINTTTQAFSYVQHGKWKASGQPAFFAFSNTAVTNRTGDGTGYTIVFGTEKFDQDNNFDGTSTFTAPVTGKYQFNINVCVQNLAAASTLFCYLNTTSTTYPYANTSYTNAAGGNGYISFSVLAAMTAGDTASVAVAVGGGAKTVGVYGNASDVRTSFSGFLVA